MKINFIVHFVAFAFCVCTKTVVGQIDEESVPKTSHHGRTKHFPKDFLFGAASSSYQVEGAWNVDGKGESIWDNFTHTHPELIADGSNGDVAANSFEFFKEDVRALKHIGMNIYRFSISWPRILPNGDLSKINYLGLAYYDKLINELLANKIQPLVTIFHFDLPRKLEDIGGMLNPVIIEHFLHYARILFEHYGDRVKLWGTFNEPNVFCEFGYGSAIIAPAVSSSGVGDYICGKNLLLSHAKVYHMYHDYYNKDRTGKIGIILPSGYVYPKDPNNPADIEAANRKFQFFLGWFAHPIFSKTGGYSKLMEDIVRENSFNEGLPTSRLPEISDSERILIRGTSDYFFLNYYSSELEAAATESDIANWAIPSYSRDVNTTSGLDPSWPVSIWPPEAYIPQGLRDLLNWIKKEYDNPTVFLTENGWANSGEFNDTDREIYLKGHLEAILDAIWEDGCNVHGHTTWALIVTFEFTSGYTLTFGLYHVDFESPNKTRTARKSVNFLRDVIRYRKIFN